MNPGPYCTGELDVENEGRECSQSGQSNTSQVLPGSRDAAAYLRVLRLAAPIDVVLRAETETEQEQRMGGFEGVLGNVYCHLEAFSRAPLAVRPLICEV